LPPGVRGPSGSQVDLDNDEEVGFDFRNFNQADYNFDGGEPSEKKKVGKK